MPLTTALSSTTRICCVLPRCAALPTASRSSKSTFGARAEIGGNERKSAFHSAAVQAARRLSTRQTEATMVGAPAVAANYPLASAGWMLAKHNGQAVALASNSLRTGLRKEFEPLLPGLQLLATLLQCLKDCMATIDRIYNCTVNTRLGATSAVKIMQRRVWEMAYVTSRHNALVVANVQYIPPQGPLMTRRQSVWPTLTSTHTFSKCNTDSTPHSRGR
jgi:hypothetical protein